jgi:hypothetical protein
MVTKPLQKTGKAYTHMLNRFGVQLKPVPLSRAKYQTTGRVMEL